MTDQPTEPYRIRALRAAIERIGIADPGTVTAAEVLALLDLAEAAHQVIDHVEAAFPAGTKVDPVFRHLHAVLARFTFE